MNRMSHSIARISAKAILFDIDNTIVTARPGAPEDPFLDVLCQQAVERHGGNADVLRADSSERIAASGGDVHPHLQRLGLDEHGYVRGVCEAMRGYVTPCLDAVSVIPELIRAGYRLYPATTNGRLACLAKLTLAGIADGRRSPSFPELFGGSDVHPAGKTTPAFYEAILARIGLLPDEVVMVGDDPHFDLALAHAAGIEQVVLPRRTQTEDITREADGGIYVRSLMSISTMLGLRHH